MKFDLELAKDALVGLGQGKTTLAGEKDGRRVAPAISDVSEVGRSPGELILATLQATRYNDAQTLMSPGSNHSNYDG